MSGSQELAVREKQELARQEEQTVPGRYYVPAADIFETDDALTLLLEMPGVSKDNVDVQIENDVLRVEGKIDYATYKDIEPVYTEYNIGHYARAFTLSNKIDRDAISARVDDGVLTLTLPKAKEAMPRRITIG
ncbi:MAG TPA: Hsp20/alpha crystallin family protein [Acetobacteraceae bacterium]|nr:Hsp20/alpha crystallin family protein [Acetobacteraceae bacterium]